jgi:hypothetical protein
MAKFTQIFHCKTFQNLPKLGFLVRKYTIWQPWSTSRLGKELRSSKETINTVRSSQGDRFWRVFSPIGR